MGIILLDCNEFLSAMCNARIVFVKRSANMVAHALARTTCSSSDPRSLSPPNFIVDVLSRFDSIMNAVIFSKKKKIQKW